MRIENKKQKNIASSFPKLAWPLMGMILMLMLNQPNVQAMTIEVHGNKVFATGAVGDDLRSFEEAFKKPEVDTVVFVNSPGGDLWTGLRVGRMINSKGYKTVTAGFCNSACSVMFMGGVERRFADNFKPELTQVGIHGAHNKDTKQVLGELQSRLYGFYSGSMGDRFNAKIINNALYFLEDSTGMLRIFDVIRNTKLRPYFCPSSRTPRIQCANYNEEDAMSLGVLTHKDLVKLELPPAFQVVKKVFGKELSDIIPDVDAMVKSLADQYCHDETCAKNFPNIYKKANATKSIASPVQPQDYLPINKANLGYSFGYLTEQLTVNASIYFCNHPAKKDVRLCEAALVDGFNLKNHYAEATVQHEQLLQQIVPPKESTYDNEEFGFGFFEHSDYKREKLLDMTPGKLKGVKTITTKDLALMLTSQSKPKLIDVFNLEATIPSAQHIVHGGNAFVESDKEAAFEKRFAALLALYVPEKDLPLVFFSKGRESWHSVNAALRAKSLGYTNVFWYRGGLAAWNAAQLPFAPVVVRAVAN